MTTLTRLAPIVGDDRFYTRRSRKSNVVTTPVKYFLDCDPHGSWYLIPDQQAEEWFKVKELLGNDLDRDTAPEFAKWVDGGYQVLVFENPQEIP